MGIEDVFPLLHIGRCPVSIDAPDRYQSVFPRFGDRLSFHGAIDEQEVLPRLKAGEVYDETTRVIDILGQRGGYVVSGGHAIQADTPPENVVAMLQAAKDYSW